MWLVSQEGPGYSNGLGWTEETAHTHLFPWPLLTFWNSLCCMGRCGANESAIGGKNGVTRSLCNPLRSTGCFLDFLFAKKNDKKKRWDMILWGEFYVYWAGHRNGLGATVFTTKLLGSRRLREYFAGVMKLGMTQDLFLFCLG